MKIPPALSDALLPLSWAYGAAVRARAWQFDRGHGVRRLNAVVISVGNITTGGSGKTPMVLWLAERLAQLDVPVGILTRGYRGGVRLDRGTQEELATELGQPIAPWSDEVALLSRRLGFKARFGVGADRWAEGRVLTGLGIKWLLLDDGFQHRRLHRDVDIVLIDSLDPFGGGRLLPSGRLREPVESLRRADILVITRTLSAPELEKELRGHTQAPIFYATTELQEVRALENSAVHCGKADWLGKKVFAFCGIGNPQGFFADVERWGMQLAGTRTFRDHHRYHQSNAQRIERAALAAGAEALLCTEKDAQNLGAVRFEQLPLFCCDVTLRVADGDSFWNTLLNIIDLRRGKSPE